MVLILMFYIACLYDLVRSFETTQMFNLLEEKHRPHFTHPMLILLMYLTHLCCHEFLYDIKIVVDGH